MMSKKDFDKVATIIYRLPKEVRIQAVVSAFDVLESEPKFDRIKFAFMAGTFPCLDCKYVFEDSPTLAAHRSSDHNNRR